MQAILANKIAIVTGASSGIGRAAALLFAQQGAAVVLGARHLPRLQAVVDEIERAGGHAVAVAGDVKDESFAQQLVETAVGRFGGLDIAFNNAGTLGEMGASTGISAAGWQQAVDVNLTGSFFAAKHQIPAMLARGRGSLIFTSTFVGHLVGFPGAAAYAASKAGVVGLMRALAVEFGPQGLRCTAICPGFIETEMVENIPEKVQARLLDQIPLKRFGRAEEVGRAVTYLVSQDGDYITGAELSINGGLLM